MTEDNHFDVVIIGSGAGGGTMAHALAGTGARILVVERGDFVPGEDENWNPAAVWSQLRYRTTEHWVDGDGREFRPYMHYVVGGNTSAAAVATSATSTETTMAFRAPSFPRADSHHCVV